MAVVHYRGQPGPLLELVPLLDLKLHDPPGKRSGDKKLGHGLLQLADLIGIVVDLIVIIVDLVIKVVDLLLVFVQGLVQLAVVLGVEQLPRRHRLSGGDIHPGDLSLRGSGGHRIAVRRHGNAGAFNGGSQGTVAGHPGQGHPLFLRKKQGLYSKPGPAQNSGCQAQRRCPPKELSPLPRCGLHSLCPDSCLAL